MNAHKNKNDRGSVIALVAVCITLFLMALAMTVDIGWMVLVEGQLQNAADSASRASVFQLIDEDIMSGTSNQDDDIIDARDWAETYAGYNQAAHISLLLDRNDLNVTDGGIVVGYIQNPFDLNDPLQTSGISEYNSVQVTASLSQSINGPLSMFLGAFTGLNTVEISARSTATVDDRILGFEVAFTEHLEMIPFTVYEDAWNEAIDGETHDPDCSCPHEDPVDNYSYNPETGLIQSGIGDGIPEISMYPNSLEACSQEGAPGNFGTIDIGPPNNSTADIIDQILYGITGEELDLVDGMILTDDDGDGVYSKWLNGDTGVSTAIRCALTEIKGQPRLLPLYRNLTGTGDTSYFEIVRFVGIRIVDVQMTGALANRHVIVQPCQVTSPKAVIHPDAPKSGMVYALSLTR